ncbi:hypothetical protein LTR10_004713 [Elasticomyces elasticus]|nr:hypothetical protein LTR10_004713 [Elasticomyces elasticus]KAK4977031.1 hypothetical protein LTR42_003077 [Elasticomyces elasticus]
MKTRHARYFERCNTAVEDKEASLDHEAVAKLVTKEQHKKYVLDVLAAHVPANPLPSVDCETIGRRWPRTRKNIIRHLCQSSIERLRLRQLRLPFDDRTVAHGTASETNTTTARVDDERTRDVPRDHDMASFTTSNHIAQAPAPLPVYERIVQLSDSISTLVATAESDVDAGEHDKEVTGGVDGASRPQALAFRNDIPRALSYVPKLAPADPLLARSSVR